MSKLVVSLVVMGAVLWYGMGPESDWLQPSHSRILKLTALVAAAGASYFATLFLLGFRLNDFKRRGT